MNFDPDTAGANAAEKTLALLTEEDFAVRVTTLDGGLDPDRYIREQGVAAYSAAVRGAKRHADYLIERARILHPGRTPEAQVRAFNFLLPHIRRIPNALQRDAFVEDAAQKLGIDSALMRQQVKHAAAQRLESVRAPDARALSELERVLLRALVLPDADAARELAASELGAHPEWYAGLPTAELMETLANASAPDNPMDAAADGASRSLLAIALHEASDESRDALVVQVGHAVATLRVRSLERRQRELRASIAAADRAGEQELLRKLMGEKVLVDRALRES